MAFRNAPRPEKPDPEIEMERKLSRVVAPQLDAYVQELDAEIDRLLGTKEGEDMQQELNNALNAHNATCEPKYRLNYQTE